METWEQVSGWLYEVSDAGRVRSLHIRHPFKLLNPWMNQHGYYLIDFWQNGVRRHQSVARLVASTFIRMPHVHEEINHKDGDKTNNTPGNLEWVSATENNEHALATGLRARGRGETHHGAKLTEAAVIVILKSRHLSSATLADYFGVSKATIKAVWQRRNWKHITVG